MLARESGRERLIPSPLPAPTRPARGPGGLRLGVCGGVPQDGAGQRVRGGGVRARHARRQGLHAARLLSAGCALQPTYRGAWAGTAGGVSAGDTVTDLRLLVRSAMSAPWPLQATSVPHRTDGCWHVLNKTSLGKACWPSRIECFSWALRCTCSCSGPVPASSVSLLSTSKPHTATCTASVVTHQNTHRRRVRLPRGADPGDAGELARQVPRPPLQHGGIPGADPAIVSVTRHASRPCAACACGSAPLLAPRACTYHAFSVLQKPPFGVQAMPGGPCPVTRCVTKPYLACAHHDSPVLKCVPKPHPGQHAQ